VMATAALALAAVWHRVEVAYRRMVFRRLARERTDYDMAKFKGYFEAEGIPDEICEVVYRSLPKESWGVRDFPVQPEDDLEEIYRIGRMGGLMIDQALLLLAEELGLSLPPDDEVAEISGQIPGKGQVQDIVRFLHVLKQRQTDGAPKALS